MGINFDFKSTWQDLEDRWERKSTLIIILLVVNFGLIFKFTNKSLSDLSVYELILMLSLSILIIAFWQKSTSLPKAQKNKIGFAVAITSDSKEEEKKITEDFIASLRILLDRQDEVFRFHLIHIPQFHSRKILTKGDAIKLREKTRCKFLIYGSVKKREINKRINHILYLEGLVFHDYIPEEVSQQFSKEFSELFPRKVHIDAENDLIAFEFTSEWIDAVSRYIIGIASYISGDIDYSETLFRYLNNNKDLRRTSFPQIKKICQRVPLRLGDIYSLKASLEYIKWTNTEDSDFLDEMYQFLIELKKVDPTNYTGRCLMSIYYFLVKRDFKSAYKELNKCREQKIADATWRYNYAFLLAYQGNMHRAHRMYQLAFNKYCDSGVFIQTEEFMLWVLKKEPDKIQLKFCLGLINWHAKGDLTQAISDFEDFIANELSINFPEEVRLAKEYLPALKRSIPEQKVAT
jgi:tetratricopeptide (TPR) repeat protein